MKRNFTINEAIYYYDLDIFKAAKIAKKMGIKKEMTEMQYIKFIGACREA